jgi:hypothetical protein
MNHDERMGLLNELVEEITRDIMDLARIKTLTAKLGITFSDDPMQLLNNVLKGIHIEEPKNESNIQ